MIKQEPKIKQAQNHELATIAALSAGIYFLNGGTKTKNNRINKGWSLKARGEVLQEMEHMKNMSGQIYRHIIDVMADRYKMLRSVDRRDLNQLVKELKSYWKHIDQTVSKAKKVQK